MGREFSCQRSSTLMESPDQEKAMKKIICLLVVLALVPSLHADKKKKNQQAGGGGGGKVPALGGGGGHRGGGGGMHLPGMSGGGGGGSQHSLGQPGHRPNTSRPGAGHSSLSTNNPLSHHSSASSSAPSKTGSGNSSNPLLHHGGQGQAASSNPLTQGGGRTASKTSNPMMQGNHQMGANSSNPMKQKGARANAFGANGRTPGKAGAAGRNPNLIRGNNVSKNAWHGQNARGFHNRAYERGVNRSWAHAAHANYHVRPYREVFHGYHRVAHDRVWYTSHYDRVVIVGGGYYYWNAGYWYPAWGYDPIYTGYVYDGPIYSYDNLPPDQVIVNVQTQLQDEGYYTGEVDGQLGQQTRDALGAYQADHGLEVTSAVDEPTVESLGLASSDAEPESDSTSS